MSTTRNLNYPSLARRGFILGAALFLIGGLGHVVGPAIVGSLPGWEAALLLDLEIAGILIGLFAPLIFGIVLPLTE
ncbi:hypothetical protein [Halorhabdus sp. CUG00001]|uniref:DUF7860 family protein n=1 Tax=Halorhabdus sp. CUG00001 TaxID=2600297 RepID=UPI00131D1984|nr:hypothetical protein [Halorhabdus sp. CUG00001]